MANKHQSSWLDHKYTIPKSMAFSSFSFMALKRLQREYISMEIFEEDIFTWDECEVNSVCFAYGCSIYLSCNNMAQKSKHGRQQCQCDLLMKQNLGQIDKYHWALYKIERCVLKRPKKTPPVNWKLESLKVTHLRIMSRYPWV